MEKKHGREIRTQNNQPKEDDKNLNHEIEFFIKSN